MSFVKKDPEEMPSLAELQLDLLGLLDKVKERAERFEAQAKAAEAEEETHREGSAARRGPEMRRAWYKGGAHVAMDFRRELQMLIVKHSPVKRELKP